MASKAGGARGRRQQSEQQRLGGRLQQSEQQRLGGRLNSQSSRGSVDVSNSQSSRGSVDVSNSQSSRGSVDVSTVRAAEARWTSQQSEQQRLGGRLQQSEQQRLGGRLNSQSSRGSVDVSNSQSSRGSVDVSTSEQQRLGGHNSQSSRGRLQQSEQQRLGGRLQQSEQQRLGGRLNSQSSRGSVDVSNSQSSRGSVDVSNSQSSRGRRQQSEQQRLGGRLNSQSSRGSVDVSNSQSSRGTDESSVSQQQVALGSLLDDQHWHQVKVELFKAHFNVTLDSNARQTHVPTQPALWDVRQISVGVAPSRPQRAVVSENFHGCVENLLYNDLNLIDLAAQRDPRVATTVGPITDQETGSSTSGLLMLFHLFIELVVFYFVTFSCTEPLSIAATFVGPQSFLRLPGATEARSPGVMSVGLQFRTWNAAGLLLTFRPRPPGEGAGPGAGGDVWLHLRKAALHLGGRHADGTPLELSAGVGLSDGQWHSVELGFRADGVRLSVDGAEASRAHASGPLQPPAERDLFFGGCPAEGGGQDCHNPFTVFQGCMRLLTLDNRPVDLIKVQQRLLGNYSHLQIDMCGITDRCSPSHCEHGGRCTQSWSSFHCNCSSTGYSGATCHSSIYGQSCEAYRHQGNRSGRYHVDIDGSGPIKPQLVYCNMTEDQTWMVLKHNNTELTPLRPAPSGGPHHASFDYASEEEQLTAIIGQSEHCEQELSYYCRKSRLLNTPEGPASSWWVGGPSPGATQTHWGGAVPGSQQCACGLQENCLHPRHLCNCDADQPQWANDSGLLTNKETLPLRALVLGDIRRPGSEAAYRVGPLRCHGDKSYWNAASFDTETSYLHFPAFNAELSAEISFLFKTTASSGVFLENLGIKDFIRIELSSSTQVVFSFDVGNGPLRVRVDAGVPLDDDRWHAVRAERNVREAALRVDALPAAVLRAPADGHISLQLNSQLFIGGTASRQKGFRGCLRSLQLNGVTLDLEARAAITPGVRPGCPGHCGTYGALCVNGGRCRERPKGFACDCGASAFTGTFCHQELSASFTPATAVRYALREPRRPGRTQSAPPAAAPPPPAVLPLRGGETVSLSFRTSRTPALLLYASSSRHRQYLALALSGDDKVEVRYRLHSGREVEVVRSDVAHLADGQLHTASVRRRADTVSIQVDQHAREDFNLSSDVEFNDFESLTLGRVLGSSEMDPEVALLASEGFTGCLSGVLFNSVGPLKAALLHPDTGPVSVSGPLARSRCGAPPPARPYTSQTTHSLPDLSGSAGPGQPLVNAIRSESALIGENTNRPLGPCPTEDHLPLIYPICLVSMSLQKQHRKE
ncbi:unnamed protein product [Boreogadus saida]